MSGWVKGTCVHDAQAAELQALSDRRFRRCTKLSLPSSDNFETSVLACRGDGALDEAMLMTALHAVKCEMSHSEARAWLEVPGPSIERSGGLGHEAGCCGIGPCRKVSALPGPHRCNGRRPL